jgi:hypothetical protein
MEFGAVGEESSHVIVVLQSVLIELDVVLLQWGVLVFWVPNWFRGHWYRVHHEEVHRVGIVQCLLEESGFRFEGWGFGFGFEFRFGFGFSIRFSFTGRIV